MNKPLIKDVQDPWFTYISKGLKIVEGRLNKGSFQDINKGDIVIWRNGNKKVKTKVISLHRHATFRNMLRYHRLKNTLPEIKTIAEGEKIYSSFYSSSDVKKYGILAIKLKIIKS
jgi:ASC-1-like (ASCH) protein